MVNILWYSYTMEYYSVTKMNEVLIHAGTFGDSQMHNAKGITPGSKAIYSIMVFIWHL